MRISTEVTKEQALALGATSVTLTKLAEGKIRQIAAGPIGSGKITFVNQCFLWTRNSETVHHSLRQLDAEAR